MLTVIPVHGLAQSLRAASSGPLPSLRSSGGMYRSTEFIHHGPDVDMHELAYVFIGYGELCYIQYFLGNSKYCSPGNH